MLFRLTVWGVLFYSFWFFFKNKAVSSLHYTAEMANLNPQEGHTIR